MAIFHQLLAVLTTARRSEPILSWVWWWSGSHWTFGL